jgi:hypothetical protein
LRARLYVVGDLKHLSTARAGERTWWCVGKASVRDDVGIIYHKGFGISHIIRFIEFEEPNEFCNVFDMATARVEIETVLANPVTIHVLRRRESEFRDLKAVRRNFQNKWFDIEEDRVEAFYDYLKSRCTLRREGE